MDACREYEGLISAFIDGEITEPERAKLMEHMAACPACQSYFDDQIAIHDALTGLEAQAPSDFSEQVMARVRAMPQERPQEEKKRIVFRSIRSSRRASGVFSRIRGGRTMFRRSSSSENVRQ